MVKRHDACPATVTQPAVGLRQRHGPAATLMPDEPTATARRPVGYLAGLACVGCLVWEPRDTRGVSIVTASSETVTVVVLYPSGESELTTYRPGEASVENNMLNAKDGCTRFVLVARTEDGDEIDRQPAPICRDEEWRIGD